METDGMEIHVDGMKMALAKLFSLHQQPTGIHGTLDEREPEAPSQHFV